MNAVEFVKKFGWNDARVCILNCLSPQDRWLMRHGEYVADQDFDDLKRIVESYELVERFGGLEKAKKYIDDFILPELSRAITDVEACQ